MKIKSIFNRTIGIIAAFALAVGLITVSPAAAKADGNVDLYMSARVGSTITARIFAEMDQDVKDSYDVFAMLAALEDTESFVVEGWEDDEGRIVFDIEDIYSQRMNDRITGVLYGVKDGENTELARIEPGFSIADACNALHEQDPGNRSLTRFMAAMLRFGAESQQYSGWRVNRRADAFEWIDEALEDIPQPDYTDYTNYLADGSAGRIKSAFLGVRDEVAVCLRIVDAADPTPLQVVVDYAGSRWDEPYYSESFRLSDWESDYRISRAGDDYVITLTALAPQQFCHLITASLYDGEENDDNFKQRITYSVDSYCFMMKDSMIAPLINAMYAYGVAANEFHSEPGPIWIDPAGLRVGTDWLSGEFSPFYYNSAADQDVLALTQLQLLTFDRNAAAVLNGIEGETVSFNGNDYIYKGPADVTISDGPDGKVYYDITLRDDLYFSDGCPISIDDLIFTFYVLLDPAYDGNNSLRCLPIEGLGEYRSDMASLAQLIEEAGRDNDDYSLWTIETQDRFWGDVDNAIFSLIDDIMRYCVDSEWCEDGDYISAASAWNYFIEENSRGAFAAALRERYGDDFKSLLEYEAAYGNFHTYFWNYEEYSHEMVILGERVPSVSGIIRTGDYSMRLVLDEFDVTAIYTIGGTYIAPLHYYGSVDEYDYVNGRFGFEKGDLDPVRERGYEPLGAGQYHFERYDGGAVEFTANERYFLGCPQIEKVYFLEGQADNLYDFGRGELDIISPAFDDISELTAMGANGGLLSGDVVTTVMTDHLGYGYIGINANNVKVGDDPSSEASKNLRKAYATALAAFRPDGINEYYGARAELIEYPISKVSWASPKPADEDYATAFSVDAAGQSIYNGEQNDEQRYEALRAAVLSFFEAAGFTVEDGRVTAAPAGASLEIEAVAPGGGAGDHPAIPVYNRAAELLGDIGITMNVIDATNFGVFSESLNEGSLSIWTSAWSSTPDPDMYQLYFADVEHDGRDAGASVQYYGMADAQLDSLILEARSISDTAQRKVLYKQCLDIIMDWAVEVPNYQRKDVVMYRTEKVASFTPETTSFYSWLNELYRMSLTGETEVTPFDIIVPDMDDFTAGLIIANDPDSPFDSAFVDGFTQACEELEINYRIRYRVPDYDESDIVLDTARELVDDEDCSYVFGNAFGYEENLLAAATEYPGVQFVCASGVRAHDADVSNYHNVSPAAYEGRYILGFVAGMKLQDMIDTGAITAEQAKVGFVGAFPFAQVVSEFTAFFLGVKASCPSAFMEVRYTFNWSDNEAEKEMAEALINAGCVLISQYNPGSEGVMEACSDAGVINTDQLRTYSTSWYSYFKYTLQSCLDGESFPADVVGNFGNGGIVFGDLNEELAAPGTAESALVVVEGIEDGSIKVFDTYAFTVNGEMIDSYLADVYYDPEYTHDTEAIWDGYFHEQELRSAPYFDIPIDGITVIWPEEPGNGQGIDTPPDVVVGGEG